MSECKLCGWAHKDLIAPRAEYVLNQIFTFIISALARFVGTETTLKQLAGQESKMRLVDFFIQEDDAIEKAVRGFDLHFGLTVQPPPRISMSVDFEGLLSSYSFLLEQEMRAWVDQTIVVGAKRSSRALAPHLPWTLDRDNNGSYRSTIPEDVMYALGAYIDEMTKDMTVVRCLIPSISHRVYFYA